MMISRRPKNRASKENAPGPSKSIESNITMALTATKCSANKLVAGPPNHDNAMPMIPAVASKLVTGVKSPNARKVAQPSMIADKAQLPAPAWELEM